jgi:drug/metabolite transporter (DMT)-like permease
VAAVLALMASVVWGCSNFIGGTIARRSSALVVVTVGQPAGLLVFAIVLAAQRQAPVGGFDLLWMLMAGFGGALSLFCFYRALAIGPMAVVGTLSALAPLVPLLIALARGERPTPLQLSGIALALFGVALAGFEATNGAGRSLRLTAGSAYALASALGAGSLIFALSVASPGGHAAGATFELRAASVTATAIFLIARRPRLPRIRSVWPVAAFVGVLDATGLFLIGLASTKGLLSVVAVLSSLYPIVIYLLARAFHHERLTRGQLVGAGLALVGVLAISA